MKIHMAVILLLGICLSPPSVQAQGRKLTITHLTGGYFVFTTHRNFKGTPFPSNGLYLVTDEGVVMIDTPWDTTQFQPLLDSIEIKHKQNVVLCIATHSHEDRTGGLAFLRDKGIKTYTSKQTYDICVERNEKKAEYTFNADTTFIVGGHTLQTYYGGEGHTKDNIVVWFDNERILYGGCLVKSIEAADLGYTKESNLDAWPETLRNIIQKFPAPAFVIPGHQDWTSTESINHTLDLLRASAQR